MSETTLAVYKLTDSRGITNYSTQCMVEVAFIVSRVDCYNTVFCYM